MTITTTKLINASQLGYELDCAALRVVGPYDVDFDDPDLAGRTVVSSDTVDDAALTAAVDAHVAQIDWVDPGYTPPPTVDELVAALPDPTADLAGFKSALIDLLHAR